jgi:hypothetical protein
LNIYEFNMMGRSILRLDESANESGGSVGVSKWPLFLIQIFSLQCFSV